MHRRHLHRNARTHPEAAEDDAAGECEAEEGEAGQHSAQPHRLKFVKGSDLEDAEDVAKLRETLTNGLVSLGVLAAFLCSLGGAIYVSPPPDPICRGMESVQLILILEWLSMGCFFLVIIVTVILAADMDGVPDDFLVIHLRDTWFLYALPFPFLYIAIFLLAIGYGLDLDERLGCPVFRFGLIVAPGFPSAVVMIMILARRRRQISGSRYGQGKFDVGRSWFMTWIDLLVPESHVLVKERAASRLDRSSKKFQVPAETRRTVRLSMAKLDKRDELAPVPHCMAGLAATANGLRLSPVKALRSVQMSLLASVLTAQSKGDLRRELPAYMPSGGSGPSSPPINTANAEAATDSGLAFASSPVRCKPTLQGDSDPSSYTRQSSTAADS